jgi:hypothetical protein
LKGGWPRNIWSVTETGIPLEDSPTQSVNYLCSLMEPCAAPASKFQWRVEAFIDEVIQRLRGVQGSASELAPLYGQTAYGGDLSEPWR